MNEVLTKRFLAVEDDDGEQSMEERDALISIEVVEGEYPIDVHLSPRTDEVETFALSVEGAWRLARDLARAASAVEANS